VQLIYTNTGRPGGAGEEQGLLRRPGACGQRGWGGAAGRAGLGSGGAAGLPIGW